MTTILLYAVLSLAVTGALSAVILYFVSQKFKVEEDPRIDEVFQALPSANCGGCGYAGCRNFAEAIVASGSLDNFYCPVGGANTMLAVGNIMGLTAEEKAPVIAVLRCSGSIQNAVPKIQFDGISSCKFANNLNAGERRCPHGCLGLGDCERACKFDALHVDKETGLPVISDDKCVACEACAKACPRNIIEMRPKGKKDRRIYVSCINEEKGAQAIKNCKTACIGCSKCFNVCPFEAITMKNNLAYINHDKCKQCRKCAPVCPTGAILEHRFPARKTDVVGEEANV